VSLDEQNQEIALLKAKLLQVRSQRIRPFRDEKILTSWNALAVSALAKAARIFEREDYGNEAVQTAQYLFAEHWDDQGRLYRRKMEGELGAPGFLQDYAQLGIACLDLFEWNWDEEWLRRAIELADEMQGHFKADQGFYDVAGDQQGPMERLQEAYDGVEPAGNSAAMMLLTRLNGLGHGNYLEAAQSIGNRFQAELEQIGSGISYMLNGLFPLWRNRQLVIVGDGNKEILSRLRAHFLPDISILWVPPGKEEQLVSLAPILEGKTKATGLQIWLCENFTCNLPLTDWEELSQALGLEL